MSAIQQYKHLLYTNAFGVAKTIKELRNENKEAKQFFAQEKKIIKIFFGKE